MTKKQYFVNVLLAYNLSKEFTYKIDKYVEIGSIVRVPFRSKKYIGIVTEHLKKPNFQKSKIKEVDSVSNKFLFKSKHLKFLDWVAKYNLIDRGNILKMMLPNSDIFFKFQSKKDKRIKNYYLSETYFDLINKWIKKEESYFLKRNGG